VRVDPSLMRPTDVGQLVADSSKAAEKLDWRPETGFEDLVRLMVDADLRLLKEQPGSDERSLARQSERG
jgi:GDPmannose 4,6-dehydratase